MTFGPEGLLPPRFNEIVTNIEGSQRATLSEPLSYQPESRAYQLNSVYARSADQLAQLIEAAFDTLKLGSAEGYHLDELSRLRGLFRINAEPSFTTSQHAILSVGASIPSGTVFYSSTLNLQSVNTEVVVGSTTGCSEATIQTNSAVEGASYGFSINGANYLHTVGAGETVEDVHNALVVLLDADTSKTFTYSEQASGAGRSFVITADEGTVLTLNSLTIKMVVETVKRHFRVDLTEYGPLSVGSGLMNSTISPVVGLISTANDSAFTLGRDQETDVELRGRIGAGNIGDCTGTPDTIINAIKTNVAGVSYVDVIENIDDPLELDGIPFMTFETLVVGGTDIDVGNELWRTRGAGAVTHGTTTQNVVDSAGLTKFVKFSRPYQADINIEVDYVLYDEEIFPLGGDAVIQEAIVQHITSLPIGKDVIAGRIFTPIYSAVAGIGDVVVRVERADALGFTTGTIPISATEYAYTNLASITITDVTP